MRLEASRAKLDPVPLKDALIMRLREKTSSFSSRLTIPLIIIASDLSQDPSGPEAHSGSEKRAYNVSIRN